MKQGKRHEIQLRLWERPECSPIYSSVHEIPERLHEYDTNLFILYDNHKGRYEVHSLTDRTLKGGAVLPYRNLDERTLQYVKRNDIRRRGAEIFRELEAAEQKREQRKRRDFSNWVEAVGKESRPYFAKSASGTDVASTKTVF